jgi:hypothetical protein
MTPVLGPEHAFGVVGQEPVLGFGQEVTHVFWRRLQDAHLPCGTRVRHGRFRYGLATPGGVA